MRLWPRSYSACRSHRMLIVACHHSTVPLPPGCGPILNGTAVLQRCNNCGRLDAFLVPGEWTLQELRGDPTDVERLIAESVKP